LRTALLRKVRFFPALLLVVYAACKGDSTPPLGATTIAPNSETSLSAIAGSTVSPAPSVIVRDDNGNPFPGATVTFTATAGGGSVSGASAVTDANGVATVGAWTLGTTAGQNTLTAASGSLSVTFNATATAGPTASLTISAGDNQTAAVGTPVAIAPAVLVKDANGNAKSGVTVTFTIGSGGGSITGASATTNASGIAAVGSWTIGSVGANTLVASTAGAPPVTFHATGGSKCNVMTTHALGTTSNGALESNDCQFSDGSFVDFFSVSLPTANAYQFKQGAGFNSYLDLALSDGTVIAENDDETTGTQNSRIKALLPAGNYILGVSSLNAGATGTYQISSTVAPTNNTNCDVVFVVKGVETTQKIETTDCLPQSSGRASYADAFYILLRAGQSITVAMSSSEVDSYLQIARLNETVLVENDNRNTSTKDAQITFTSTETNYYAILARTAVDGQTGNYSLTIQ
jgi:hypothetical protein